MVLPDTLVATLFVSGYPSAQQPHPYIPLILCNMYTLTCNISMMYPLYLSYSSNDIPPLELTAANYLYRYHPQYQSGYTDMLFFSPHKYLIKTHNIWTNIIDQLHI